MEQGLTKDRYCSDKAFPTLTISQRERMQAHLALKTFKAGKIICEQDAQGDKMYFIEEGIVQFYRRDRAGKGFFVRYLKAGDFFGEIALLTNKPRSLYAEAKGEVHVWEMNIVGFDTLLEISPKTAKAIMREMARRMATSAELITDVKEQIVLSRTQQQQNVEQLVRKIGTVGFALLNVAGIGGWIVYNLLAKNAPDADFSKLGLFVTCEALLVAILVLVKQNRDADESDTRVRNILNNVKSIVDEVVGKEKQIAAPEERSLESLKSKDTGPV